MKHLCIVTGCGKAASYKKKNALGVENSRNYCSKHHRMRTTLKLDKKDYCENRIGYLGFTCTATMIDRSQLHVDHHDGDRGNNSPDNLRTLCANCHSVKTFRNGDHSNRYTHSETTFSDFFK